MASDDETIQHHPPILNVIHFAAGKNGVGPRTAPLTVVTVRTPNTNYPRARISLMSIVGSSSFTVHQAATLRDQLAAAIVEVLESCPVLSTPDEISKLPEEPIRG